MEKSEAMSLAVAVRAAGNAAAAATLTMAIFARQNTSTPATPQNIVSLYHEVAALLNKPH